MDKLSELGNTGIRVSRLSLGCGFRGLTTIDEASNMISEALDLGVLLIDCANVYRLRSGEFAENALGKVIKKRRHSFVITSKFGAPLSLNENNVLAGASKEVINKCIDISLKRLQTDYIDIYLLHGPDKETKLEEVIIALDNLCHMGKIRSYGFCNHDATQIRKACKIAKENNLIAPSVVQNSYNLINRSIEMEMINLVTIEKLGFMAYSPLAAGLLSGFLVNNNTIPSKSTWGYNSVYKQYLKEALPERVKEIAELVHCIAENHGVSSAVVATAWILKNKAISTCIMGCDTKNELMDSLLAYELDLSENEIESLDLISNKMGISLTAPEVAAIVNKKNK